MDTVQNTMDLNFTRLNLTAALHLNLLYLDLVQDTGKSTDLTGTSQGTVTAGKNISKQIYPTITI
jgi:hypothetical protein